MDRTRVSSTNILSIGYDQEHQILEVEFVSGSTYSYAAVPQRLHTQFMSAPSKGRFFDAYIKDKYQTSRIR